MVYLKEIAFLVVCVTCFINTDATDIPDFMKVCKKNDPDLSACLIEAAEELKPILKTGAADYNIPSLEPLFMEELIREQQGNLQITATNVKVFGASNFNVREIDYDMDNQKMTLVVELPNLLIECEYGIDGKILLLPIKGSGPMCANVTDIVANVVLDGELVDVDDGKRLNFVTMSIKAKVGGGTGRLENLFNGDKVLGDIINDTINKNMEGFLKELMPFIEKNLATTFIKIANNIVSPYTYDQLFPDN